MPNGFGWQKVCEPLLKRVTCLLYVNCLTVTVCGADEPSAGRAGLSGCCWLPLRSDRRKTALLLSGGPSVFSHQDPHQLPLQGNTTDISLLKCEIKSFCCEGLADTTASLEKCAYVLAKLIKSTYMYNSLWFPAEMTTPYVSLEHKSSHK